MQYKHVVLGGTFDRLHDGHKEHIRSAFEAGERITIGLTDQVMNKDKVMAEIIEPYEARMLALQTYIKLNWKKAPYHILSIQNMFGPTLTDPSFDAIAVTPDTKPNGLKVISERKKAGLNELSLVECELVPAADGGHLSSTRIRLGQIDRHGEPYKALFNRTLMLNDFDKDIFRTILGLHIPYDKSLVNTAISARKIIEQHNPSLVITVGDVVTDSLLKAQFSPDIAIIDTFTERRPVETIIPVDPVCYLENEKGTIQKDAVFTIEEIIRKNIRSDTTFIMVHGEEDLLAIPCILLAPLNSIVVYGQKNAGIVINIVSEKMKQTIVNYMHRFETV